MGAVVRFAPLVMCASSGNSKDWHDRLMEECGIGGYADS